MITSHTYKEPALVNSCAEFSYSGKVYCGRPREEHETKFGITGPPRIILARHFKHGDIYKLLLTGVKDSSTTALRIIYQGVHSGEIWDRREEEFWQDIERDGYKGPRFTKI